MRYLASPPPLLGPCRCQGCGEAVFWARRRTTEVGEFTTWLTWRDRSGHVHRHDGRQRRYLGRKREGRYPQIRHETVHHAVSA
jgi:hypothetical protein